MSKKLGRVSVAQLLFIMALICAMSFVLGPTLKKVPGIFSQGGFDDYRTFLVGPAIVLRAAAQTVWAEKYADRLIERIVAGDVALDTFASSGPELTICVIGGMVAVIIVLVAFGFAIREVVRQFWLIRLCLKRHGHYNRAHCMRLICALLPFPRMLWELAANFDGMSVMYGFLFTFSYLPYAESIEFPNLDNNLCAGLGMSAGVALHAFGVLIAGAVIVGVYQRLEPKG